jgi:hypothetical protein
MAGRWLKGGLQFLESLELVAAQGADQAANSRAEQPRRSGDFIRRRIEW